MWESKRNQYHNWHLNLLKQSIITDTNVLIKVDLIVYLKVHFVYLKKRKSWFLLSKEIWEKYNFLPFEKHAVTFSLYPSLICWYTQILHNAIISLLFYTLRVLACCSQSELTIFEIRESSARALFLYNCTPNTLRRSARSVGCTRPPS